ncbi:MAG: TolC family protein [Flavobacteriales bacterium]|nr:TolC family protein [Flavobacteriales bacterium]
MSKIHFLGIAFMLVLSTSMYSQVLELQTCLDSAETHMPLLDGKDFLANLLQNKIKAYNRSYLPIVTINGQGSYQSAVPELPFALPGTPGLEIPQAQYRAYAEFYQPLFDAGAAKSAKETELAETEVNLFTLQVNAFEFKRQVAQLFFQLLYLKRQQEIVEKSLSLMRSRELSLEAALEQGVVQRNDMLKLQSAILSQQQKLEELQSAYQSGSEVLELLTGINTRDLTLELPVTFETSVYSTADNPHLKLFQIRQNSLMAREDVLKTRRMPRISAFGQAGIGAPNPYNFFEPDLSSYYIVGVRANWTLWDWGRTSLERKNLHITSEILHSQQEQKRLEIESNVTRLISTHQRLLKSLDYDTEQLELRTQIRQNAESQLTHGVITTNEYLEEVLSEQVAALTKSLDEISLHQTRVFLQFETGLLH